MTAAVRFLALASLAGALAGASTGLAALSPFGICGAPRAVPLAELARDRADPAVLVERLPA